MDKLILLPLILLNLAACVSTHPGVMAKTTLKDSKLLVSADENPNISDQYYMFVEYTFENQSEDWIKVKVSRLGFENESTEILVNDKLSSWLEGAELKLKKNQHNTGVILGGLTAVGGIAAASSSNGNVQVAGFGTMIGATGAATAIAVGDEMRAAGSGRKGLNQTVNVPQNHIFYPFQVAPGSYVKRWVVVKTPKSYSRFSGESQLITELTQNGVEAQYKINL